MDEGLDGVVLGGRLLGCGGCWGDGGLASCWGGVLVGVRVLVVVLLLVV